MIGSRISAMATAALLLCLALQAPAHARPASTLEIARFEADFSSALARNDVASLGRDLSDDWRVIGADGHVITKARFLAVIASGDLKHEKMSSQGQVIRRYGDTAVVTARLRSAGSYKGQAFHTDEIGTDVVARIGGRWVCVLTQLTTAPGP